MTIKYDAARDHTAALPIMCARATRTNTHEGVALAFSYCRPPSVRGALSRRGLLLHSSFIIKAFFRPPPSPVSPRLGPRPSLTRPPSRRLQQR